MQTIVSNVPITISGTIKASRALTSSRRITTSGARSLLRAMGRSLALLMLTASIPAAAQNLLLTLAAEPPSAATMATRDGATLGLTVAPGATVTVTRERGRDYRLQSGGGFFWTQVEEVPRDADSVTLTPTPRDDGSFEIMVAVLRKAGTEQQQYTSTVVARPGEWVRLLGPAQNTARSTRVYSTRELGGDAMYLQLVPAITNSYR
jgi:hypothetical protein